MAKHNRESRLFARALRVWAQRLALREQWKITYDLVDKLPGDSGEADRWMSVARCLSQGKYRKALIEVRPDALASCTDSEIDGHACHELLHVVMTPLRDAQEAALNALPGSKREGYVDWYDSANEQVTEHLTRVLCSLERRGS